MSPYTARAVRWEHGWEIHIDGLGVTQCRILDQSRQQAMDYIETMTGETGAKVTINVDIGEVGKEADAARDATREASRAVEAAAAQSRKAARDLRKSGLSVTDSAYILGVSRGRISQLTK